MPYVARVLRGAALRSGASPTSPRWRCRARPATAICLRHLIPNMMPLIVAQATIMFGWAMVDLAAISFLGLGVQPPSRQLGRDDLGEPDRHPAGLPAAGAVRRGRASSPS